MQRREHLVVVTLGSLRGLQMLVAFELNMKITLKLETSTDDLEIRIQTIVSVRF